MLPSDPCITVFWFRRDLRLADNHGLYRALEQPFTVLPVFIFDPMILSELRDKRDKRVSFIHRTLTALARQLESLHSTIWILHAEPVEAFRLITQRFSVGRVFANEDYEPYAIERDQKVKSFLAGNGIPFETVKDQVIFGPADMLKPDGSTFVVYTPYSKEWKKKLMPGSLESYSLEPLFHRFLQLGPFPIPSLNDIGFSPTDPGVPAINLSETVIREYGKVRNFPALRGTSHASLHLRFGTVSIRELVRIALKWSPEWLNELIWREFFMMILFHYPHTVSRSFKPKYDDIEWRNNEDDFIAWKLGNTGYPLVDAGMRELNETGWMHNRVRMVAASFLTKDLLIDWRWGEAWFAEKLLDYELSSNVGNWQWVAGSGCDAAPYFRIFNPNIQVEKFDPGLKYIRTWIPGYREGYLQPIVDHEFAKARALECYKKALNVF